MVTPQQELSAPGQLLAGPSHSKPIQAVQSGAHRSRPRQTSSLETPQVFSAQIPKGKSSVCLDKTIVGTTKLPIMAGNPIHLGNHESGRFGRFGMSRQSGRSRNPVMIVIQSGQNIWDSQDNQDSRGSRYDRDSSESRNMQLGQLGQSGQARQATQLRQHLY